MALKQGPGVKPVAAAKAEKEPEVQHTEHPAPKVEQAQVVEVEERVAEVAPAEEVLDEEEPAAEEAPVSPSTEVVQHHGDQLPVAAANNPTQNAINSLAAAGFEGLALDFSSFIGIVLNDGEFECTDGTILPNTGFHCRLTKSRSKFAFRSNHPDPKQVQVVYSYERIAASQPDSVVAKRIQEWKDTGADLGEVKEYTEVSAVMIDDGKEGKLNGQLVMLSIPPTSRGRLSGFITTQQVTTRRLAHEYVTHISRAAEKVTKVDFPFYPWAFALSPIQD